jgi:hypothetical protein
MQVVVDFGLLPHHTAGLIDYPMGCVRRHLHGRVSVSSIQNHDRCRREHRHPIRNFLPGQKACARRVTVHLLPGRSVAAPILCLWAQGLQYNSVDAEGTRNVVQRFAGALQDYLIPVLLCNLLVAWWRMTATGVASLQLPVRYAITSSSAELDCVFLVPLIPHAGAGPGAGNIARLAALQVRCARAATAAAHDTVLC